LYLNFSIEEQQKFLPKLVFKLKSYYKPMIHHRTYKRKMGLSP